MCPRGAGAAEVVEAAGRSGEEKRSSITSKCVTLNCLGIYASALKRQNALRRPKAVVVDGTKPLPLEIKKKIMLRLVKTVYKTTSNTRQASYNMKDYDIDEVKLHSYTISESICLSWSGSLSKKGKATIYLRPNRYSTVEKVNRVSGLGMFVKIQNMQKTIAQFWY